MRCKEKKESRYLVCENVVFKGKATANTRVQSTAVP